MPPPSDLAVKSVRELCQQFVKHVLGSLSKVKMRFDGKAYDASEEIETIVAELERRSSPPAVPPEADEAWERIMADSEGPIRWEKTTTGYQLLEAAVKRELTALRPSAEAVEAAERILEAHKFHEPRDCNFLVVAREIVRLAGVHERPA